MVLRRLQVFFRAGIAVCVWTTLLLIKPVFGYLLQVSAHKYISYYNARYQKLSARTFIRSVTAAGAKVESKMENFSSWQPRVPPSESLAHSKHD